MNKLFLIAAICVLGGPALAQSGPAPGTARANFIGRDGNQIGTATLTQTPHGVLLDVNIRGLPPGEHGFHIHETGRCDPASGFESAGGHFAGQARQHGYHSARGPHAGDMPNQFVGANGELRAHVFNPAASLRSGQGNLLDGDGSAIVVHARPDDYRSQPSGEAGDRIACAVIEPSRR